MTTPRAFGLNGRALYTNVASPQLVNLQWTVTPTNGLGITSLMSNGYVNNVFMHTSTTPSSNGGYTNPNPANGYALIQLKQNINVFLGMRCSFQVPTATSTKIDNAALTVGNPYVISVVGDSTTANWQSVGLPVGITPALGVSFIATATGVAGSPNTSTSRVQIPSSSGIDLVEVVGDPVASVNTAVASNAGMWVMLKFSSSSTPAGTISQPTLTMNPYTPAGTNDGSTPPLFTGTQATLTGTVSTPTFTGTAATKTATAPATGSVVSCQLWFDGSSVTIDGL